MKLAGILTGALLSVAAFAVATAASAQGPGVSDVPKAQMAKLAHMAGRWSGAGWMMVPQVGRKEFASEETVTPHLDGAALLIEGLHRDKATQAVVHHALGLLAYDVDLKTFRMSTALANGRGGSFTGGIDGRTFTWHIETPGAPRRRFVIAFPDDNTWTEVGEYTMDGTKWVKFFEMALKRVK